MNFQLFLVLNTDTEKYVLYSYPSASLDKISLLSTEEAKVFLDEQMNISKTQLLKEKLCQNFLKKTNICEGYQKLFLLCFLSWNYQCE